MAATGENLIGMKLANTTPKGTSQEWENFKTALKNLNPAVAAWTGWDRAARSGARPPKDWQETLEQMKGPISGQTRVSGRPTPSLQEVLTRLGGAFTLKEHKVKVGQEYRTRQIPVR
jgi:hypothetical protein